jgi:hypothetical protein
MCCFFTALMVFGPRLGFLVYWILVPARVTLAFADFNLPWLVGIAGLLFAPWTILMYVVFFPLNGFDWVMVGLGIAADVASYLSAYNKRAAVPGYPGDPDFIQ